MLLFLNIDNWNIVPSLFCCMKADTNDHVNLVLFTAKGNDLHGSRIRFLTTQVVPNRTYSPISSQEPYKDVICKALCVDKW